MYLEGKEPALEDLKATLHKAVVKHDLVPVLCGSALKNKGVQLLLDAVVDYLPNPLEVPPVQGRPKDDKEILCKPIDDAPFAGLVFKIAADPVVGKLAFFRLYSGVVTAGSYVLNTTTGEKERVGRIVRLHANHREEVQEVYAGEIAATVGLKNDFTGTHYAIQTTR